MSHHVQNTYCLMHNHEDVKSWLRFRASSVSRFGEISPLWPKVSNLWQIFEGISKVWQNVELTLVKNNVQGQIFFVANGQISKNNPAIWSHCFLASGNDALVSKEEISTEWCDSDNLLLRKCNLISATKKMSKAF